MITEPDFIIVARQLAEESLAFRFNTKNLFLALFLEAFATKPLIKLLSPNYPGIRPIPSLQDDMEGRLQHHFDPILTNAVLGERPASDSPGYQQWLTTHAPENVSWKDFGLFLALCDAAMTRWHARRKQEVKVMIGAHLIAFLLATGIQFFVLIAIYWRGFRIVDIALLVVAMLVTGFVCRNPVKIT